MDWPADRQHPRTLLNSLGAKEGVSRAAAAMSARAAATTAELLARLLRMAWI